MRSLDANSKRSSEHGLARPRILDCTRVVAGRLPQIRCPCWFPQRGYDIAMSIQGPGATHTSELAMGSLTIAWRPQHVAALFSIFAHLRGSEPEYRGFRPEVSAPRISQSPTPGFLALCALPESVEYEYPHAVHSL